MENTTRTSARRRVRSIRDHVLLSNNERRDGENRGQESLSNFFFTNARGDEHHQETTMTMHRTSSNTYASATGKPTSYEKMHGHVSQEPVCWEECVPETEFSHLMHTKPILEEVIYEKSKIEDLKREGGRIARITINRPEKRNAFTPKTIKEMQRCFDDARDDASVGVVVLRGAGDLAFCSGGDQSVRGDGGYVDDRAERGGKKVPRLNGLDLQMQIRRLPKPILRFH